MIRVALVDDHRMVREGLKWMLADEPGIEVVGEASSGGQLYALLDVDEVDVVILDIRIPGQSGLEIVAELAGRPDAPRILMLSMYSDPSLVKEAVVLGASGYLRKSAGRDELVQAIRVVSEGRPYLQGDLARPLMESLGTDHEPLLISPLDREVLRLMADGLTNRQIAGRLGAEDREIRSTVERVMSRLGVRTRSEAVAAALRLGVVE